MGLQEIAGEAVKALVLPKTNDLETQQRWRWMVFASIIALAVSFSLHIALACGYFPAVYSGFATTNDVSSIQKQVAIIATLNIEREIRSKTAILCTEKNAAVRQELDDDIAKLQKEYHNISGDWYKVPRCEQL